LPNQQAHPPNAERHVKRRAISVALV